MLPEAFFNDRTLLPRLGFRVEERQPIDGVQLAESIARARDVAFFCDTSLFDDRTSRDVWNALLDAPGRLVITPRVWKELNGWLRRRQEHPVRKAISREDSAIALYNEPGTTGQAVFDYYVTLLGLRRRTLAIARERFRTEHGRERTAQETANRVQHFYGERGILLANKASPDQTDEALVYLAVEHALTTGRQSVVLTADADIEEQFFKLLWLIDTHYRAMLLADRYATESVTLRPRPFPEEFTAGPRWPFEIEDAVMIDRGEADLRWLLPERFSFVAVACWTVGDYLSSLAFGAEREMTRLLSTKNRTGGLSTDRLGSRNLHVWLFPVPLPEHCLDRAAVVRDRRVSIGGSDASVARLDVLQALGDLELHLDGQAARESVLTELSVKGRADTWARFL